ncbi:MAG: protein kinase [Elusimicrobiota bacterium]
MDEEQGKYQEAIANLDKKRRFRFYLAGVAAVLVGSFAAARWRMRVLGQPDALPIASGASASYVLLGGTFRLEREWGKDRLGVYYGAVDVKKGGPVIVWLLREDAGFSPAGAKAAAAAAQRAATVRHPGIAGIRAILQEDDRLCLVLDAMEGSPLNALLGEGKRASLATAVGLVSQASAALNAAHAARVLHGRLRPADITLAEDGKAKVHMLGVPQEEAEAYMAPEQAGGALLPASDVFALAACTYEFLVGVAAFPGPEHGEQKRRMLCTPPSVAVPGLPKALDEVFRKAFFPDPAQRYRSCGEFASGLEGVWSKEKRKRSGREA